MLPLTLQFVIATIVSAINERTLEEVRVLKEAVRAATGQEWIPFTPDHRRRLTLADKDGLLEKIIRGQPPGTCRRGFDRSARPWGS